MSGAYIRPYRQDKPQKPIYRVIRGASRPRPDGIKRAVAASVIVHIVLLGVLIITPMPKAQKIVNLTLEKWQTVVRVEPAAVIPLPEEQPAAVKHTPGPEARTKTATPVKPQTKTPPRVVQQPKVKTIPPAQAKPVTPPPAAKVESLPPKTVTPPKQAVTPVESNNKQQIKPAPEPVIPPAQRPKPTEKPEAVLPAKPSEQVREQQAPVNPSVSGEGDPAQDNLLDEWDFLNEQQVQDDVRDVGRALLALSGGGRHFTAWPKLDFLDDKGFTARVKYVKIELTVAADGTILRSIMLPPGSGDPALDRFLRNALSGAFLNDVSIYGKGVQTAVLTINFKE